MDFETLSKLVASFSQQTGVDPHIALAMIEIESGNQPWTFRYEPNNAWTYFPDRFSKALNLGLDSERVSQDTSYGLTQIMGSTARSMGFRDYCSKLFRVDLNLFYGLSYLKKCLLRYDDLFDAVASYNAGVAKKEWIDGQWIYQNQYYVNRFKNAYEKLNRDK